MGEYVERMKLRFPQMVTGTKIKNLERKRNSDEVIINLLVLVGSNSNL